MRRSMIILLAALMLTGCGKQETTVTESGNLEIPVESLSETIQIYPVAVDGLQMEILAAKDADGTVRTAFNTCQVCNGSRKAYFVAEGNHVVCQNCGNTFGTEDVGILSGGCNPYPIFAEDRENTQEYIRISYEYLSGAKELFTKWKNNGK